jgi:DNA-binding GntR family transcriptional regulator
LARTGGGTWAQVDEPATADGLNVEQIHHRVREAILLGELPADAVKSQVALSAEMQVGRTPLREALRLLQAEGLVIGERNRRVRIAPLSTTDAEELFVSRVTLETAAVRLTVPTLSSADIAQLEGFMAQMNHYGKGRDWAGLRSPHRAFHALLVGGAGERLKNLISVLFDHAERYRIAHAPSTPEAWAARQGEHRAMIDAISAGDVETTARLLVDHYVTSARIIFRSLDPQWDPVRLRDTLRWVMPGAEKPLG